MGGGGGEGTGHWRSPSESGHSASEPAPGTGALTQGPRDFHPGHCEDRHFCSARPMGKALCLFSPLLKQ